MELRRIAALLATTTALTSPSTALAIGNGVPDGNGHPNVGLLAIEEDGAPIGACSGSYAGARKAAPATGVFLTAAHCLAGLPASTRFWVTFDSQVIIDPETFEVTATTWYQSTGFDVDAAFGHDRSNVKDYGVVLLGTPPPVTPVRLPSARLLDALAARGGLRPGSKFETVGYGLIPSFKTGPPQYELAEGRMLSTSLFQGLTQSWLKLLMNSDVGEGNGGVCFGDSGAPKFLPRTNTAVALTSGGDAICRAENHNQRLDVADARAFLGRYLNLP